MKYYITCESQKFKITLQENESLKIVGVCGSPSSATRNERTGLCGF